MNRWNGAQEFLSNLPPLEEEENAQKKPLPTKQGKVQLHELPPPLSSIVTDVIPVDEDPKPTKKIRTEAQEKILVKIAALNGLRGKERQEGLSQEEQEEKAKLEKEMMTQGPLALVSQEEKNQDTFVNLALELGSKSSETEAPLSKEKSPATSIREKFGRFFRKHFKGEYLEEEQEPVPLSNADVAKDVSLNLITMAASFLAVKSAADVPRWFTQKYYTGQEIDRLKDVFKTTTETHVTKDEHSEHVISAETKTLDFDERTQKLREAIDTSAHFTEDKRFAFRKQLDEILEQRETKTEKNDQECNEAIFKLIDETVQTRVKGSTAFKEGMNTVMTGLGLKAARSAVYGGISLYERYQRVNAEIERGDRKEGFLKEFAINGFKETWDKVNKGNTRKEKIRNTAEALGTVMRIAGFTKIGIAEFEGEGLSHGISLALDAFLTNGLESIADNFEGTFHHLTESAEQLGGIIKGGVKVAESTWQTLVDNDNKPEPLSDVDASPVPDQDISPDSNHNSHSVHEVKTLHSSSSPLEKTSHLKIEEDEDISPTPVPDKQDGILDNVRVSTMIPGEKPLDTFLKETFKDHAHPEQIFARGLVTEHGGSNSITGLVMKQFHEDASFGVSPEQAQKLAVEAAKKAGFISDDGETWLTKKAIGEISIAPVREGNGWKIIFMDKEGARLSMEDLKARGFIMEKEYPISAQVPEDNPSEKSSLSPEPKIVPPPSPDDTSSRMPTEPPPSSAETPPDHLPPPSEIPRVHLELPQGNVDFTYGPSGEVTGVKSDIALQYPETVTAQQFLLKEKWKIDLKDDISISATVVERSARELYTANIILEKLKTEGKEESPEALFLKSSMKKTIERIERMSGGVFDKDDETYKKLFPPA